MAPWRANAQHNRPPSHFVLHPMAMSDWPGWIEPSVEAALAALACLVIFEGARRLARGGFTPLAAMMLAVGLLAPVVEGGASLRLAERVRLLVREMPAMNAGEPAGGWEKAALSPEERTRRSTEAAQINYRVSGHVGEVMDAGGKRMPFVPAVQDLRDREDLVRGQKGAEDAAGQFGERGVRLLASSASFLVFGVLAGLFQRRRAARIPVKV